MRSGLFNRNDKLAWMSLAFEKKARNKFSKIIDSLQEFIRNRDDADEQRKLLAYLELYVREAQADLKVKHGEATRWRVDYTLHELPDAEAVLPDSLGSGVDSCVSIIDEDNKPFKQCKTKEDVKKVYKALWDKREAKNRKRGGSFKSYHGITNMRVTKWAKVRKSPSTHITSMIDRQSPCDAGQNSHNPFSRYFYAFV